MNKKNNVQENVSNTSTESQTSPPIANAICHIHTHTHTHNDNRRFI